MLYSIVGLLVIILDQAVKYWVQNTLFGTDIVKFIPGVISLVNVHNDGAAFSFLSGSGARIYFIIATGVFTVLVCLSTLLVKQHVFADVIGGIFFGELSFVLGQKLPLWKIFIKINKKLLQSAP